MYAELKENNFDLTTHSHSIFKCLTESIAFPGKIINIPEIKLKNIERKNSFILSIALTLLDIETTFYLKSSKSEYLINYIEVNTSSKFTDLEKSDYIFLLESQIINDFKKIKSGTLTDPDKSATIFYLINSLSYNLNLDKKQRIKLTGPGIKDSVAFDISDISITEIENWIMSRIDYPLGVDIFLIDFNGNIVAIPRSSKIEIIN